jgi:hypothetical protein
MERAKKIECIQSKTIDGFTLLVDTKTWHHAMCMSYYVASLNIIIS